MPADRFDRIEGDKPLPDNIKQTLSNLGRFDHLEIGTRPPPSPPSKSAPTEKVLCLHCGQANEKERSTCWACFQPLEAPQSAPKPAPKGPSDITIVLDGITYKSSDPNLPDDVKELMRRIHEQGYSQELVADWRSWRASRNEPAMGASPFPDPSLVPVENQGKDPLTGNEVFKGQRSAVIRLDGKIYTSTDMELTPEMKELFRYIEDHGVTPALMEHLRQIGKKATVRPDTTARPSVEDLAFWDHAQKETQASRSLGTGEPLEDDKRPFAPLVLIGAVILYVLLRLFFGHP